MKLEVWWAREDSNLQPSGYEPLALTIELRARRLAGGAELEHFGPKRKCARAIARVQSPAAASTHPASSARGACLTGPPRRAAAISVTRFEDYVAGRGRDLAWPRPDRGRTGLMVRDRLHHDIEVAERATGAAAFGIIIAAFVLIAAGTAVYDIGKWLALW